MFRQPKNQQDTYASVQDIRLGLRLRHGGERAHRSAAEAAAAACNGGSDEAQHFLRVCDVCRYDASESEQNCDVSDGLFRAHGRGRRRRRSCQMRCGEIAGTEEEK